MKPIPSQEEATEIPCFPLSQTRAPSYSKTNRRTAPSSLQAAYPWLLFAGTAVAAAFCLAYIAKPVIPTGLTLLPESSVPQQAASSGKAGKTLDQDKTLPDPSSLPGDDFPGVLPPRTSTVYPLGE